MVYKWIKTSDCQRVLHNEDNRLKALKEKYYNVHWPHLNPDKNKFR